MTPNQIAQILPGLKGAQLSVLIAFTLSNAQITLGRNLLTTLTGYSNDTVTKALRTLQVKGHVQRLGRYDSWALTQNALQLPFPFILEDGEGENFTLPHSSSSRYTLYEENSNIESTTTTTTNTESEGEISALPKNDDDLDWVLNYLQQRGCFRSHATKVILAALNAGWSTAKIRTSTYIWDHYTKLNTSIDQPALFIAKRILELDPPPKVASIPCPYCFRHTSDLCLECGGCPSCCDCETINQEEMTQ